MSGVATVRGSLSGKGVTGSDFYKWNYSPIASNDMLHPNAAGASGTTGIGANLAAALLLF